MPCRAVLALALSTAFLAGCEGGLPSLGSLGGPFGGDTSTTEAQEAVTVTRQEVNLSGTRGFCVDPVSTRDAARQAFVVFGNCAAITGDPTEPQPWLQAVVTATVTASDGGLSVAPQAPALLEFFRTPGGRATLSRTEDAQTVSILESFIEDGSIYLHVRDTSPPVFGGAQNTYWRGYTDADGTVVALSVIGFEDTPISGSDGISVLRGFMERTKQAEVASN